MPQAIAQSIAAGRLGSITFKDTVQHMDVIDGDMGRFVATSTGRFDAIAHGNERNLPDRWGRFADDRRSHR